MQSRMRKRHWSWNKRGTMLSRKRNMKSPKSFTLTHFNWIPIRDHFGPIEQFVETLWKNMTMLWLTVWPHFLLIQNAQRQTFILILAKQTAPWSGFSGANQGSVSIWKPFQVNNSKRKCSFGIGSVWWSKKIVTNHYVHLEKNRPPISVWKGFVRLRKEIDNNSFES